MTILDIDEPASALVRRPPAEWRRIVLLIGLAAALALVVAASRPVRHAVHSGSGGSLSWTPAEPLRLTMPVSNPAIVTARITGVVPPAGFSTARLIDGPVDIAAGSTAMITVEFDLAACRWVDPYDRRITLLVRTPPLTWDRHVEVEVPFGATGASPETGGPERGWLDGLVEARCPSPR